MSLGLKVVVQGWQGSGGTLSYCAGGMRNLWARKHARWALALHMRLQAVSHGLPMLCRRHG